MPEYPETPDDIANDMDIFNVDRFGDIEDEEEYEANHYIIKFPGKYFMHVDYHDIDGAFDILDNFKLPTEPRSDEVAESAANHLIMLAHLGQGNDPDELYRIRMLLDSRPGCSFRCGKAAMVIKGEDSYTWYPPVGQSNRASHTVEMPNRDAEKMSEFAAAMKKHFAIGEHEILLNIRLN